MKLLLFVFISLLVFSPLIFSTEQEAPTREALFYQKLRGGAVKCEICFRKCVISRGRRGFCRNKQNVGGKLVNTVHSSPSAVHIDPIEKEPMHHFLPGSNMLAVGTAGCNFTCRHCQNWHLSQSSVEDLQTYKLSPEELVRIAKRKGLPTISFTYNEATSFYEYVYDVAKIAKREGVNIIWHSNGTMAREPLLELLKYTDGVAVDLKGFTAQFYREITSGELEPVLETLKTIKESGVWLEIVYLVITDHNDNMEDIRKMCVWVKENLGPDVPLHFSRFFPNYRLTSVAATSIKTLEDAYKIARDIGINYVSIGNVPGHKKNSTFCPECDRRLIHRVHFGILENNIRDGRCRFCKHTIAGVWEK